MQHNVAQGSSGLPASGGIWSNGTLTLQDGTVVQSNLAVGDTGDGNVGGLGANAYGGGVYVAGGTVTLTNATIASNTLQGGHGAQPFPRPEFGHPR